MIVQQDRRTVYKGANQITMVHSPHLQTKQVMVALEPELSTSQKLHCPTTHLSFICAHANQPACAEKMHMHIICNIYIFIGLNATTIEEQGDISLQG